MKFVRIMRIWVMLTVWFSIASACLTGKCDDENKIPITGDLNNDLLLKETVKHAILANLESKSSALAINVTKELSPKEAYAVRRRIESEVVDDYLSAPDCRLSLLLDEVAEDFGRDKNATFRNSLIFAFLKRGDNENLTRLLAVNCPVDRMGLGESIESALALWPANATKGEGVLILCDAWSHCKSNENKRRLAAALRRGFQPMGVSANEDPDFIAKARKWGADRRDSFEPNADYRLKAGGPYTGRTDIPLFVPAGRKPSSDATGFPPFGQE